MSCHSLRSPVGGFIIGAKRIRELSWKQIAPTTERYNYPIVIASKQAQEARTGSTASKQMMSDDSYDMDCMERGRGGGGGGAAHRRMKRQQSALGERDWSFELGHMAIFGGIGDGSEEAIERAEARAADQAVVELVEGGENDDDYAEPAEPAEDYNLGTVFVVNRYTQDTVSEAAVVSVIDEDTGKEMVEFRGVRAGRKKSQWVLRVEYHETVLETMRAVGAMAYKGDVPGPAIEITLSGFDTSLDKFVGVESPDEKTWTDVRRIFRLVSEFDLSMTMHNPHAVIVRSA